MRVRSIVSGPFFRWCVLLSGLVAAGFIILLLLYGPQRQIQVRLLDAQGHARAELRFVVQAGWFTYWRDGRPVRACAIVDYVGQCLQQLDQHRALRCRHQPLAFLEDPEEVYCIEKGWGISEPEQRMLLVAIQRDDVLGPSLDLSLGKSARWTFSTEDQEATLSGTVEWVQTPGTE